MTTYLFFDRDLEICSSQSENWHFITAFMVVEGSIAYEDLISFFV